MGNAIQNNFMFRRAMVLSLSAAATAFVFAAGFALGQVSAPTETRGVSVVELRSLDLTSEIDSVAKRALRMRKATLEPGGVVAEHNHVGRPSVSYFLQGSVVFHEAGKPDLVVNAGEGIAEGKATTHWLENRGTVPAVWITVDIGE